MIIKEIIGIFLLLGTLQIFAADYNDKSLEISHEFHKKQIKHFQGNEKEYRKKIKPELQFQKDYSKWENKKLLSYDFNGDQGRRNYMEVNEVDSNEYIDKYNKYGKVFNPNSLFVQKDKSPYHNKRESESESHHEEHEKPGSLLDDLNVNYLNNKKEVSGDSEFITHSSLPKSRENYEENYQNENKLNMKRIKKEFNQNLVQIDLSNPPPPNDTILMARYLVHTVDWAALGTLSARRATKGSPFVCVKAISDGMKNASTGIPYFYMSPKDLCTQDLQKDNQVSILVTLSQTEYCKNQNLDPQDPRCARLTMTGKIKKIEAQSEEEKFARDALFSRHPAMKSWPADHHWYFTKLKIGEIILLDQFGGATYIRVKDYLKGKVTEPKLRKK